MLLKTGCLVIYMKDFGEVYNELIDSDVYEKFYKEHTDYKLAHGFIQLNGKFEEDKPWQLGFYSETKDNLAVFSTKPLAFVSFEEAFKQEGKIAELDYNDKFTKTHEVVDIVKSELKKNHPSEILLNLIVILQTVDKLPIYNITAVTQSFAMINFRIDALTGSVIKEKKQSIMDLKKND